MLKPLPYLLVISVLMSLGACEQSTSPPVSYHADVQPILDAQCVSCHSENGRGYLATGLKLTDYASLMAGRVITPGSTSKSTLSIFIHPNPDPNQQMPLGGGTKLTKREIETIDQWIDEGAQDN